MKTIIKYTTYEGTETLQTFIGVNADSIDAQIVEFEDLMHYATKKFIAMKKIIILLSIAFALSSCANVEYQQEKRFREIEVGNKQFHVFVDTEAGVEYIYDYYGGFKVLVDKDGKPLIYNID